jgi:hypothetical protein
MQKHLDGARIEIPSIPTLPEGEAAGCAPRALICNNVSKSAIGHPLSLVSQAGVTELKIPN